MRLIVLLICLLTLGGCATASRYDAAGDVHALLIAIRDNDRQTFERHVDRQALKQQIEHRLRTEAGPLGALIAGPAAQLAGEALVQPGVFRRAAEHWGYRPGQPIPNRIVIAQALKPQSGDRVCATRESGGPCLLTFTRRGDVWRLSGFEGELSDLRGLWSGGK